MKSNVRKSSSRNATLSSIAIVLACAALAAVLYIAVNRDPVGGESAGQASPTVPTLEPRYFVSPALPEPTPETPKPEAAKRPPRTPKGTLRGIGNCHNSTDPRCGRFYWSPAPAPDQPLRLEVEIFPVTPYVGETVTFRVVATDGDARIREIFHRFGDGDGGATHTDCAAQYGPWSPPAREAGSRTVTFTHVYNDAGQYQAQFIAESGDCGSPYGSRVGLPVNVDVASAPQDSDTGV